MTRSHVTLKAAQLQTQAYKILRTHVHSVLGEFNITTTEWLILGYAYKDNSLRYSDFSRLLNIEPSNTTNIIGALFEKGLIEINDDLSDKRIKRVSLSHKGDEIFSKVEITLEKQMKMVMRGVTKEELDTYFKVLNKVIGNGNILNGN